MAFMNINLLGDVFTDYHLADVGVALFELEHDWFTKQDLVIRTGPAGGGDLLTEGVDYVLDTESTELSERVSAAVGAGRNVYHYIAIINAPYQIGDLYFSGKYIADSNDAQDVNLLRDMVAAAANYVVSDTARNPIILVTAGAVDRTVTLPTAADNTRQLIDVLKVDAGVGIVTVGGEGAETINGAASVVLKSQYDRVRLLCDGAGWLILELRAAHDTGYVNCNDWTNQHLGDAVGGNVAHKLGVSLSKLSIELMISPDGTDATSFRIVNAVSTVNNSGITIYQVDLDTIKVQTHANGLIYIDDNGVNVLIDTENWYYRVRVYRLE